MSNFNEARNWLLIAFCLKNSLYKLQYLRKLQVFSLQSFTRYMQLVYHLSMPYKIAMPRTIFCFHIHASKCYKLEQLDSTLHCCFFINIVGHNAYHGMRRFAIMFVKLPQIPHHPLSKQSKKKYHLLHTPQNMKHNNATPHLNANPIKKITQHHFG